MLPTESDQPEKYAEFYVDEFLDHSSGVEGMFVTASSQLASTVADYSPSRAFDGNYRTTWIEGIDGDGIGEWLEVEFQSPVKITRIYIVTGFHKTHEDFGDLFTLNSRLKRAEIEFDGGLSTDVGFHDSKLPQVIDLDDGVTTRTFRLTIKDAYPGAEWDDLCISEIMFEIG